jgi:putative redox protein
MKVKLNNTVTHLDDMHFQGQDVAGNVTDMDSGPADAVTNGTTPMDLILQALGGCSGMDVVNILRKRKLKPDRFEIKVEGVKRETFPRRFEEIDILYRATGKGLTLKELERAVLLSMNTYCSVSAMLKGMVEINWKCEIIADE